LISHKKINSGNSHKLIKYSPNANRDTVLKSLTISIVFQSIRRNKKGFHKTMWRSVFLHEFLDSNIRNFHALAGTPTPDSLTLVPSSSPPLQTNAVHITSGRGFKYVLEEPLDQVIGVSGRVHIRVPFSDRSDHPILIMGLGDIVELKILQKLKVREVVVISQTALLRIGQTEIELGTVYLPGPLVPPMYSEVKFYWHTSGQARLLYNGQLVGYHNAVARGAQFDVTNVVFGMPDAPPATNPGYDISRVFVRVLRRPDSLSDFSKLHPEIPFPDPGAFERCQLAANNNLLAMGDRLRQFMSLFHENSSQPWTITSGPAEGPFQPRSITAHEFATQAGIAFARMMRTGDFSASDAFLEPFEKFLRILHDALPEEFTSLAEELINTPAVPEECTELFQSIREENKETLGQLLDLLSKANDRAIHIAGGV
jgi:hypothetical protein